jgi:hypothetical protein
MKRELKVKTYRGIVRGNTVILEQEPGVQEGTEAIVLIQTTEDDEQEIGQRQKAMLERGVAIMNGDNRLIDTNVLVYAYDISEKVKRRLASQIQAC